MVRLRDKLNAMQRQLPKKIYFVVLKRVNALEGFPEAPGGYGSVANFGYRAQQVGAGGLGETFFGTRGYDESLQDQRRDR